VSHAYLCDYCGEEIDPGDDSVNLKLETVEQEPSWARHFCCTSHLINWVNEDPNELQPHLALGD
jgi:hypothetical protein